MAKQEKNKDKKYITVKDCTLYWAYLHKVSDRSGKYQVNLCNLSKGDAMALKEAGLTVHEGKEKGHAEYGSFIVAKTVASNGPVQVVDSKRNTIVDATNVGNGTKANVNIVAYWHADYGNGEGVGCGLQNVQVIELVEYSAGGGFEEVEGYVAPQTEQQPAFD